ncbi:UDP-N-acetylmuramate dehydrogenase [Edaphobacter modestus]|uniref:UDP-N-acetylenolpyruvoylglucosamine reductase n=1 Tax=Edaphobacter modestus TaxID=388466 RepID=A0A4Q7YPX1_9BACT|nr:UDP-N-acetylmuramate dehydrogenase [Edaphobacter modestus]RZU39747.1 UDP-N-acetylmuramate dehydrogenase [Edaphobacter modestus]
MQPVAIDIQQNISLAPFTTLRIGGPARFFSEITTEAGLLEAVAFARQRSLKLFVLGGGSNLLISDTGFDGLVLRIALDRRTVSTRSGGHIDFTVPAGLDWNAFVLSVCQQGISGVECLAGIPGTVGGTPVQNVGAYGQEVSGTIVSVRALDLETMRFVDLSNHECGFAYRRSIFNTTHRGRYIVTAVTFRFDRDRRPQLTYADLTRHFGDAQPTPLEVYHAVREIRHAKGMLIVEGEPDSRSAGSFFKNPIVAPDTLERIASTLHLGPDQIPHWPAEDGRIKLPAAWLLERAGFVKGYAMGNAGISSRHTLALINRCNATAADILALRDAIQHKIKTLFGIQLEQEPVQLG